MPVSNLTFSQLCKLLQDMHYGDQAQRELNLQIQLYGPNNKGTNMSLNRAFRLSKALKAGKKAESDLMKIGYLDSEGHYTHSLNPFFRSAQKWYEKKFL